MARPALHCSFCGKKQGDVRLVAGPRGVYICNLCVALCTEILAHDTPPNAAGPAESEAGRTDPEPPSAGSPGGGWIRTVVSS